MQLMKTLLDMRITQKRILQAAILIKIDCYYFKFIQII
jgi:hypothetical protein